MSIKELSLHNFRNISTLNIDLRDNKVLCFVGENGSSKTSVLSLIVESIAMNTSTKFPNYVTQGNKRYRAVSASEINREEKFYAFQITYSDIFGKDFIYKKLVVRDRDLPIEDYNEIISGVTIKNNFFSEVRHKVSKIQSKEDFVQANVFLYRPGSRYESYDFDYMKNDSDFSKLENSDNKWGEFPYSFEVSYVGKNLRTIVLEMVYDAILGYKDSRLGVNKIGDILQQITGKDFGKMSITKSPFRTVHFGNVGHIDSLSQGEMDIFVTISSIIKRQLYIYQKYDEDECESLGISSFFHIPGIVIIDEIDLHLHPRAQERYIDVLTNIFPNINFIISTHSPFIIRGLPENSLVVSLPSGLSFEENFKAMDIDSITNIIFKYEGGFSRETELLLKEFKALIVSENNDLEKLKSIYSSLSTSESAKEELQLLMATFSPLDKIKAIMGDKQ